MFTFNLFYRHFVKSCVNVYKELDFLKLTSSKLQKGRKKHRPKIKKITYAT